MSKLTRDGQIKSLELQVQEYRKMLEIIRNNADENIVNTFTEDIHKLERQISELKRQASFNG